MASKEVDGSDPLNSIVMRTLFQQLRCIPLPLFFSQYPQKAFVRDNAQTQSAEKGSSTWTEGGHRRQLGQESERSRVTAKRSPKSPTPPSSPRLAGPLPSPLHAPPLLLQYLERCHPAAAGWAGEGEQTLYRKTLSRGSWSHHSLH